jgi:alpha-1,3-rhamnosyl/mannosyltransferase
VRVVVNQLSAVGQKTGIGHYTIQLLRCLREQTSPDQIAGYTGGWVHHLRTGCCWLRSFLEPREGTRHADQGWRHSFLAGSCRETLHHLRQYRLALLVHHFRAFCARHGCDVYHEPNFIPLPSDYPTVATLHDLSVLLHPEWHPADRVAHFERHFRRGLDRCAHFLAISEFGRQEVIRTLHLPPERVTRTYMGIRPNLRPLAQGEVTPVLHQLGLPLRYLLYVGTLEPRKNVLRLLQAYCALPPRLRSKWPLVLVGCWGWNSAALAEYLHGEARHRGVLHVGYLAEEHLAAVYSGARALVYPSLYEGFGLPPLEMMACGGAVLASTAGALVETVGSRAHLVDPEDIGGWHDALVRLLEDDDWWQSLRDGAVAVARPYTWDRCASETLRVYRSLTGANGSRTETLDCEVPEVRRAAG